MNTIGASIAKLRKEKGMTQEELAGIIGVSAQSVSKWETGTTMPDIMLLPVIASTFEVSIDSIFGKKSTINDSISAEAAFDTACEELKRTIAATGNCGHNATKPFETQLSEYNNALSSDKRMRSVIIRNNGIVYYRNEVGGLLLKKPKDGWQSLLADENAVKVITLLANRDFMKALYVVTKTDMNAFTMSSLCRTAEIEDGSMLEGMLKESGLFTTKAISVDDKTVDVYELTYSHRLFSIFAVLRYAKEYAEYDDVCYYFYGDTGFLSK